MKKSKIRYYLARLSPAELQTLREFLASEIGAGSPLFVRILDICLKKVMHPEDEQVPDHPTFWAELYPDRPYNANYCHRILSSFLKAVKSFIAWQVFRSDPHLQDVCLLRGMNDRGMSRYFPDVYASVDRNLDRAPQSVPSFYYRMNTAQEMRLHETRSARISGDLHLTHTLNSLDQHFWLTKLRLACLALIQDLGMGTHHDIALLDAIEQQVSGDPDRLPPLTRAYYLVLQGLQDRGGMEAHHELMALLEKEDSHIAAEERKDLLTCAQTYCILRANEGHLEFGKALLGVMRLQVREGLLLEAGHLPLVRFSNVLVIMMRYEAFEEAREFLEQGHRQLLPEFREMAYQYHLGVLEFRSGNFRAARLALHHHFHLFKEAPYILGARAYLCKCYFEMGDSEALDSELTAFARSLQRNHRLSASILKNYRNFVRQFRHLLRAITGPPDALHEELLRLRESIGPHSRTHQSRWLLAKLDALKKE